MVVIKRLMIVEEWWPGQRENVRTARIEVWTDDPNLHWALEVGRITADRALFEELREMIEAASPLTPRSAPAPAHHRDDDP